MVGDSRNDILAAKVSSLSTPHWLAVLSLPLLHLSYGESHWCHGSVVLDYRSQYGMATSRHHFQYADESVSRSL